MHEAHLRTTDDRSRERPPPTPGSGKLSLLGTALLIVAIAAGIGLSDANMRHSCVTACTETRRAQIADEVLPDLSQRRTGTSPKSIQQLRSLQEYWTRFLDTIVQSDVYANDDIPKAKDPAQIKTMLEAIIAEDDNEIAEMQTATVDGITETLIDTMGVAGRDFVDLYGTRYEHVLRNSQFSEDHYRQMRQKALADLEAAHQQMSRIYQEKAGGNPGDIPGEETEYQKFERRAHH